MRELLRGLAIGLALLAVFAAIAGRIDGPGPWLVSRALGVTAFVALSLDVVLGLLMSTRIGDRWWPRAYAIELHRWMSLFALVLIAGHAAVLLLDHYVEFDLLDVIVPFAAPGRRAAVGVGVSTAYLVLAVHLSFGLRRRIGVAMWRRLHYLSFVGFLGACVHGLSAGSDATRPWLWVLIGVASLVVAGLVLARVPRGRSRSLNSSRAKLASPG